MTQQKSRRAVVSSVLYKAKFDRLLDVYWGSQRLTVLAYHRITDAALPSFDLYRPNVSATPEMFERHIAYIVKHFNVISLKTLQLFLRDGHPLPNRPLLITFDDGYLDNYINAYPVLRRYKLPAVLFLISEKMNQPTAPWWDACAYYFFHTTKTAADLPVLGQCVFDTSAQRDMVCEAFIQVLKKLPEATKLVALQKLGEALGIAEIVTGQLFVSWDQVRELVANGVSCQPHTLTHPIMTRIDSLEQKRQLAESRGRIEAETGQTAIAFAYPNGMPLDYDSTTIAALRDTGYQMAFTLSAGPARISEVKAKPLEIRRVFMGNKDTFEMAVLKMLGLPALLPD
jgi:peptidoglycan/xylan/chitin deacetylase (PgdA/CDA1 family)